MNYGNKLMSFWKRKRPDGTKDQEFNGTKRAIETPNTSTTKRRKEERKMRLEVYGTRMGNGVKMWKA